MNFEVLVFGQVSVLVPIGWTAESPSLFKGPAGLLDVRLTEADGLIGPGRLRRAVDALGGIGEIVDARVVRHLGFPACSVAVGRDSDDIVGLTYLVGFVGDDGTCHELRATYALRHGQAELRAAIRRQAEDLQLSEPLGQASVTPNGELAFYPVTVPCSWKLLGDDGEEVAISHNAEGRTNLELAGGHVVLISTDGVDRGARLIFSVVRAAFEASEHGARLWGSEYFERVWAIAGWTVAGLRTGVCQVKFTNSMAGWFAGRVEQGEQSIVVCGFVFVDAVGYTRKLEYRDRSIRYSALAEMLDEMVVTSTPFSKLAD